MDPLSLVARFWFLILFFIRPSMLFAVFCFVAGGVATLESTTVNRYMHVAAEVYQRVIYPDLQNKAEQVLDVIKDTQNQRP